MRAIVVVWTFISLALCLVPGSRVSAHPGSGIVVDKLGQIYFTDTGQGVWKIDTQGKLTYMPASMWHWMAIDESGFFSESEKSFGEWFERVTPQSSKPALIMCSEFPLTMNLDGNLYYADSRRRSTRIVRRTPDGTESVLAHGDMFRNITGIAAGPDGSLYVTDASRAEANTIRKIAMDGTVSMITADLGRDSAIEPPTATPAGYCRGLAVDSQGVVYVAATGSRRVLRVTPQGRVSTVLQAPSPWSPTGVALFRGELYVLEWRDTALSRAEVRRDWIPRVRKIGRDGTVTILVTVTR